MASQPEAVRLPDLDDELPLGAPTLGLIEPSPEATLSIPGGIEPGLDLLVDLVREGSLDPRHLDLIDITDRYLAALDATEPRDLPSSGEKLFYACVLLRLKAELLLREGEGLVRLDEAPDGGDDPFDGDDLEHLDADPFLEALYDGAQRAPRPPNLVRPRPGGTPGQAVTLHDLVAALRACARREKARRLRERLVESGVDLAPVESAHQENIQEDLACVRLLVGHYLANRARVPFDALLDQGLTTVTVFTSLLFLTNSGEVLLEQETPYEDLHIVHAAGSRA